VASDDDVWKNFVRMRTAVAQNAASRTLGLEESKSSTEDKPSMSVPEAMLHSNYIGMGGMAPGGISSPAASAGMIKGAAVSVPGVLGDVEGTVRGVINAGVQAAHNAGQFQPTHEHGEINPPSNPNRQEHTSPFHAFMEGFDDQRLRRNPNDTWSEALRLPTSGELAEKATEGGTAEEKIGGQLGTFAQPLSIVGANKVRSIIGTVDTLAGSRLASAMKGTKVGELAEASSAARGVPLESGRALGQFINNFGGHVITNVVNDVFSNAARGIRSGKMGAMTEDALAKTADAIGGGEGIRAGAAGAIDVAHGTPHGPFDEFKDEHVGSGEGEQAFGWGHYVAGREAIAEYYAKTLADKGDFFDGVKYNPKDPRHNASSGLERYKEILGDPTTARREYVKDQLDYASEARQYAIDHPKEADKWIEVAKLHETRADIIKNGEEAKITPGKAMVAHATIDAEPEHFLRWDEQFAKQSDYVKSVIESRLPFQVTNNMTGQDVVEALVEHLDINGGYSASDVYKQASKILDEAGIRGVMYPDSASRGPKTEGVNFNYAVFDPKKVKINKWRELDFGRTAITDEPKTGPKEVEAKERGALVPKETAPLLGPIDPAKPIVEFQQNKAGEFLAQEKGQLHPPLDIDSYFNGTTANPLKINLDRVGSPDDVRDAIARVSAQIPDSPVQSHEATMRAAEALNMTPELLMKNYGGQPLKASEMYAARMILDSSASQLVGFAKAAAMEGASPEAQQQFLKAYSIHHAIQSYVEGAMSEAGRTLNSLQIMSKQGSAQSKALAEMMKTVGNPEEIAKEASRIADLGDPLKVSKFLAAAAKNPDRNALLKIWYNALLSSPTTLARKGMSDAFNIGFDALGRLVASTYSKDIGPMEAWDQLAGAARALPDAIRIAGKALRAGESQFMRQYSTLWTMEDAGNPVRSLMNAEPIQHAGDNAIMGGLSYLRAALPTSWIGAADDLAKYTNYEGAVRALVSRAARAEGLSRFGEGAQDWAHYMESNMNNVPEEIHQEAMATALRNTFQDPLSGPAKALAEVFVKANIPIAGTEFKIPIGRMIMPFTKVPFNIMKWSYRNTAVGLVFPSEQIRSELAAGGATRDLLLAKMGLGTSAAMGLFMMAANNQITGRGPSDREMQHAWRAAGNEPYSLKAFGNNYNYNGLEPLALTAGAMADTVGISRFAKDEDRDALATSMVFGLGNALMSKTYLSGLADFFDAMHEPDTKASGWMDRMLATMAMPQGAAAINKSMDDWQRSHYDLLEAVEARTPYVAQGLPVQRNLWGDPIPLKDAWAPLFGTTGGGMRAVSPITVRPDNPELIDKWIWDNRHAFRGADQNGRLGFEVPGLIQTFEAGPKVSAHVELNPWQHDRLVELAGNGFKDPSTGLGAKDYLNALVNGNLPNSGQQAIWDKAPPMVKADMVRSIISKFRAGAKQQLVTEFPNLRQTVEEGFKQSISRQQQQQPEMAQ